MEPAVAEASDVPDVMAANWWEHPPVCTVALQQITDRHCPVPVQRTSSTSCTTVSVSTGKSSLQGSNDRSGSSVSKYFRPWEKDRKFGDNRWKIKRERERCRNLKILGKRDHWNFPKTVASSTTSSSTTGSLSGSQVKMESKASKAVPDVMTANWWEHPLVCTIALQRLADGNKPLPGQFNTTYSTVPAADSKQDMSRPGNDDRSNQMIGQVKMETATTEASKVPDVMKANWWEHPPVCTIALQGLADRNRPLPGQFNTGYTTVPATASQTSQQGNDDRCCQMKEGQFIMETATSEAPEVPDVMTANWWEHPPVCTVALQRITDRRCPVPGQFNTTYTTVSATVSQTSHSWPRLPGGTANTAFPTPHTSLPNSTGVSWSEGQCSTATSHKKLVTKTWSRSDSLTVPPNTLPSVQHLANVTERRLGFNYPMVSRPSSMALYDPVVTISDEPLNSLAGNCPGNIGNLSYCRIQASPPIGSSLTASTTAGSACAVTTTWTSKDQTVGTLWHAENTSSESSNSHLTEYSVEETRFFRYMLKQSSRRLSNQSLTDEMTSELTKETSYKDIARTELGRTGSHVGHHDLAQTELGRTGSHAGHHDLAQTALGRTGSHAGHHDLAQTELGRTGSHVGHHDLAHKTELVRTGSHAGHPDIGQTELGRTGSLTGCLAGAKTELGRTGSHAGHHYLVQTELGRTGSHAGHRDLNRTRAAHYNTEPVFTKVRTSGQMSAETKDCVTVSTNPLAALSLSTCNSARCSDPDTTADSCSLQALLTHPRIETGPGKGKFEIATPKANNVAADEILLIAKDGDGQRARDEKWGHRKRCHKPGCVFMKTRDCVPKSESELKANLNKLKRHRKIVKKVSFGGLQITEIETKEEKKENVFNWLDSDIGIYGSENLVPRISTTSMNASTTSLTASTTSLTESTTSLNTSTTSLTASTTILNASTTCLTASTTSLTASTTSLTASTTSLNTGTTSLTTVTTSLTVSTTSLTTGTTNLTTGTTSLNASSAILTTSTPSLIPHSSQLTGDMGPFTKSESSQLFVNTCTAGTSTTLLDLNVSDSMRATVIGDNKTKSTTNRVAEELNVNTWPVAKAFAIGSETASKMAITPGTTTSTGTSTEESLEEIDFGSLICNLPYTSGYSDADGSVAEPDGCLKSKDYPNQFHVSGNGGFADETQPTSLTDDNGVDFILDFLEDYSNPMPVDCKNTDQSISGSFESNSERHMEVTGRRERRPGPGQVEDGKQLSLIESSSDQPEMGLLLDDIIPGDSFIEDLIATLQAVPPDLPELALFDKEVSELLGIERYLSKENEKSGCLAPSPKYTTSVQRETSPEYTTVAEPRSTVEYTGTTEAQPRISTTGEESVTGCMKKLEPGRERGKIFPPDWRKRRRRSKKGSSDTELLASARDFLGSDYSGKRLRQRNPTKHFSPDVRPKSSYKYTGAEITRKNGRQQIADEDCDLRDCSEDVANHDISAASSVHEDKEKMVVVETPWNRGTFGDLLKVSEGSVTQTDRQTGSNKDPVSDQPNCATQSSGKRRKRKHKGSTRPLLQVKLKDILQENAELHAGIYRCKVDSVSAQAVSRMAESCDVTDTGEHDSMEHESQQAACEKVPDVCGGAGNKKQHSTVADRETEGDQTHKKVLRKCKEKNTNQACGIGKEGKRQQMSGPGVPSRGKLSVILCGKLCVICNETVFGDLRVHYKQSHPFRCVKCRAAFQSKQEKVEHWKSHSSGMECKVCNRYFFCKFSWQKHTASRAHLLMEATRTGQEAEIAVENIPGQAYGCVTDVEKEPCTFSGPCLSAYNNPEPFYIGTSVATDTASVSSSHVGWNRQMISPGQTVTGSEPETVGGFSSNTRQAYVNATEFQQSQYGCPAYSGWMYDNGQFFSRADDGSTYCIEIADAQEEQDSNWTAGIDHAQADSGTGMMYQYGDHTSGSEPLANAGAGVAGESVNQVSHTSTPQYPGALFQPLYTEFQSMESNSDSQGQGQTCLQASGDSVWHTTNCQDKVPVCTVESQLWQVPVEAGQQSRGDNLPASNYLSEAADYVETVLPRLDVVQQPFGTDCSDTAPLQQIADALTLSAWDRSG